MRTLYCFRILADYAAVRRTFVLVRPDNATYSQIEMPCRTDYGEPLRSGSVVKPPRPCGEKTLCFPLHRTAVADGIIKEYDFLCWLTLRALTCRALPTANRHGSRTWRLFRSCYSFILRWMKNVRSPFVLPAFVLLSRRAFAVCFRSGLQPTRSLAWPHYTGDLSYSRVLCV